MVTADTAVGPPILCAKRYPGGVDLVGGLAPQLREKLDTLCHTGGARRVTFGFQAAARVHRQVATHAGDLGLHQFVGTEPFGETEVLVADQLHTGEVIVHLGDVHVRRCHTGHRECLLGGADGGGEGRHIRLVLVHNRIQAESDSPDPHRPVGEAVHHVLGCEYQRGGAVALRRAVVHTERGDHGRRGECLLHGDLKTQARLGVVDTMAVVLHRHHGHVLTGGWRFMQISPDVEREARGCHQAERVIPGHIPRHGFPLPQHVLRRGVAKLFGTHDQGDVESS